MTKETTMTETQAAEAAPETPPTECAHPNGFAGYTPDGERHCLDCGKFTDCRCDVVEGDRPCPVHGSPTSDDPALFDAPALPKYRVIGPDRITITETLTDAARATMGDKIADLGRRLRQLERDDEVARTIAREEAKTRKEEIAGAAGAFDYALEAAVTGVLKRNIDCEVRAVVATCMPHKAQIEGVGGGKSLSEALRTAQDACTQAAGRWGGRSRLHAGRSRRQGRRARGRTHRRSDRQSGIGAGPFPKATPELDQAIPNEAMNPFSREDDALILAGDPLHVAERLCWTEAEVMRRKAELTGNPAWARLAGWRERLPARNSGTLFVLIIIDMHAWIVDMQGRTRATMRLG